MTTLEIKVAELKSAARECERQFYLPKHRKELSDLRPSFWHALGHVVLSIAIEESAQDDAAEITRAIAKSHRQLGAPGDFGYGNPCGEALRALYDRHREVCGLLIVLKYKEGTDLLATPFQFLRTIL